MFAAATSGLALRYCAASNAADGMRSSFPAGLIEMRQRIDARGLMVRRMSHTQGNIARQLAFALMESAMEDEVLRRGRPDRSHINMSEEVAVKYWSKHLEVSREQLQQLVEKVGNSASAVRKELRLNAPGGNDGIA
jgi:hypothetical protein